MTFPDNAISLPPCESEHSDNCFYDATLPGAVLDVSFFRHDGADVLILVPSGAHIESVQVAAEGLNWDTYAGGPGYGVTFTRPDAPVSTSTTEPEPLGLAATGADLTFPVALVVVATVLAVAGIALAWKGRAR